MSLEEKGYKFVSASAATIENVAKPAVKHSHKLMLEGSRQIHSGIDSFLETIDDSSHNKVSWVISIQFFNGLRKINKAFHGLAKYSITANYQDTMTSLKIIENGFNERQQEYEEYFDKNNKEIHHNWAFNSENREVIRELLVYVRESTREFDKIPYHRLLQYFIAFGRIQKIARKNSWAIEKCESTDFLLSHLEALQKYAKYATGIYGKNLVRIIIEKKWAALFQSESDEQILLSYCSIPPENLIFSHIMSKKYYPGHAIILEPTSKKIILIIRGTMSVFDCMTDMKGDYTAYDYIDPSTGETLATGLVHSGIFTCARNLANDLKPKVLELFDKYQDYELIITGHSLGAGATSLLALLWLSDPEIMQRGFFAYAYAPPAVVSEELNVFLKERLFSCAFGNDIVTRLSFGSVKDFCSMADFFHQRERQQAEARASEVVSNLVYGGKMDVGRAIELYNDVKATFTNYKLEAPGNMYQMYEKKKHLEFMLMVNEESKEKKYVGGFVDQKFYQEIVFCKTTFSDHMPNFYQDALEFLIRNDGDEENKEDR